MVPSEPPLHDIFVFVNVAFGVFVVKTICVNDCDSQPLLSFTL